MRKEILSFTGDRPDGRLIHILEEAAVHTDGFTAEQDSFFVFVMRPDMIKELEALSDEEGASRNAQMAVIAFSDPAKRTARSEALFSLHAMAMAAEKEGYAYQFMPFAVKVFQDPAYDELAHACGVPDGYGCAGALAIGISKEEREYEPRYSVFSYIQ